MENWSQHRPETFEYVGTWIRNWFSNFAPIIITVDGYLYESTESYYQAMKTTDIGLQRKIAKMSPRDAKKAGKHLEIRLDWEEIKYDVMRRGLRAKFYQEGWMDRLLSTGDEILIEWNNWNDRIWGVSIKDNLGHNLLGKALMEIRAELRYIVKRNQAIAETNAQNNLS